MKTIKASTINVDINPEEIQIVTLDNCYIVRIKGEILTTDKKLIEKIKNVQIARIKKMGVK